MYDCIIIGSGPAGISASIYMVRAGLKILVISENKSIAKKAEIIENYYGFDEPISGEKLMQNGINQAKRLGVNFLKKEVVGIKYAENNCYEIIIANQGIDEKFITKTVILATGINRKKPNIKGIAEFEGKGISYCAICDAMFYKNKNVAVLGNGYYAIEEIDNLSNVTSNITMLTNGKNAIENRKDIEINTKKIKEFYGEKNIEKVVFEDGTSKNIDGVFIAEGTASSVDFAKKIGAKIKENYIVVNDKMETNVPNIYACGDCTGGILQISKAVYQGTVAGLEIIKKIKNSRD